MKKLDKKQIPQFAALCVLTAGLSGYLVMHLVAPSRVSAQTRPAAPPAQGAEAKPGDAKPVDAKLGDAKPGDPQSANTTDIVDAPPPSPAMHDPFAVGYVDPKSQPAAAKLPPAPTAPALPKLPAPKQTAGIRGLGAMPVTFPPAPALPAGLSSFPAPSAKPASGLRPAPSAPALPTAPLWTVTGVLEGAAGNVAILRSGDARRIVHSGDFVDSVYRVIGVTRTSVTLRRGAVSYQLPLGGAKAAPAKPSINFTKPNLDLAKPVAAPAAPFSVPAVPGQAALLDGAVIPAYHTAQPQAALAEMQSPEIILAPESLPVSGPNVSPVEVADAAAAGLHLRDGDSVLTQNNKN